MDKRELKITEDGSHTLFVEHLNETYHSKHGAIQESDHVFIKAGLNHCNKKHITILEIGFGTGLNAFLSLQEAMKSNRVIDYSSIEAYPLTNNITAALNYPLVLGADEEQTGLFHLLHEAEWGYPQKMTEQFSLHKIKVELANFYPQPKFDVIYFDAFGPDVQPEMWTVDVFQKMYNALNIGGILVTYCAKGVVKRNIAAVGFTIENLPGPPGKREITRAVKYE